MSLTKNLCRAFAAVALTVMVGCEQIPNEDPYAQPAVRKPVNRPVVKKEVPKPLTEAEKLRSVSFDLGRFSPKGFRWLLPSYLEAMVMDKDEDVVENFIYQLSVESADKHEVVARFLPLERSQLLCIEQLLRWLQSTEYYGHYLREDLKSGFDGGRECGGVCAFV